MFQNISWHYYDTIIFPEHSFILQIFQKFNGQKTLAFTVTFYDIRVSGGKEMKRKLITAALAGILLTGCAGGKNVSGSASGNDSGKTTVEFWYAGGKMKRTFLPI